MLEPSIVSTHLNGQNFLFAELPPSTISVLVHFTTSVGVEKVIMGFGDNQDSFLVEIKNINEQLQKIFSVLLLLC